MQNRITRCHSTAGQQDRDFVNEVYMACWKPPSAGITVLAGNTSLVEMADIVEEASAVLTTDMVRFTWPMHWATHTIVLFGAGNDKEYCTV